jgi:glutathione S-transferase
VAPAREPILWHIGISHYSEKVRWALAHKGVEHRRRAPQPGLHMLVALGLTGGRQKTFPVLQLDGERIGDSTAIIAALEERFPDPPLYPAEGEQRRRALALEGWFDEQVGPQIRLLAWHELIHDQARLEQFAAGQAPGPLARFRGVAAAYARSFVNLRYRVDSEQKAEQARRSVLEGLDRLEQELGGDDYLVGGRFTVADLTAAAILYPLVLPPEGPKWGTDAPPSLERFRAPLKERRGYRWVQEMFRRHRLPGRRAR